MLFKASFGCSLMYKYKMLIVFFCPVHVRVPWAARGGRAGCQAQLHLHRPLQVDRAHPPPPLDNNTKSDGQQQHHHPIDSSQHVLPQSQFYARNEEKQKTSPNFLKIIEILLFSGEGVALLFLNGGLAERSSPFLANDFEKTENIFFRVHYEQIIVYVDDFS